MIRILIADDSQEVSALLAHHITKQENWRVCGRAANGRQALLMAYELRPDLIIMDASMPMMDGLNSALEIRSLLPDLPIVLYTLNKTEELESVSKKAGIRKVVSKAEPVESLLTIIREVLNEPDAAPSSSIESA